MIKLYNNILGLKIWFKKKNVTRLLKTCIVLLKYKYGYRKEGGNGINQKIKIALNSCNPVFRGKRLNTLWCISSRFPIERAVSLCVAI